MLLAKEGLGELYDGLLYNFLYNNDINSIHILLNLYDIEINTTNIYPKYRCTKDIRKKIKRLLFPRRDRQLISNNVSMLVHEDIDRLELVFYLKGYYNGYNDTKWVNCLEDETLKQIDEEDLYEKNFLFHYDTSNKEIQKIIKELFLYIDYNEEETNALDNIISSYCNKVIKRKIYNLNSFIDKQLTISYSQKKPNIKEEDLLTHKQLKSIYKSLIKTIEKNMINTYKEAYWFGINDRVLSRYK
ncbi:MAG: hypothetical protein GXZ06_08735 [Tissierellia bacterium]|nr:hypothetical protein [Tissierellia bacterium]